MMKNSATKGLVISILLFIFSFGIYFLYLTKKNEYLVDNPTLNTYFFKLNNGEEKIISGGQFVKVDLNLGKNKISVFDQNKKLLYDSVFQVNKLRGLINIAQQDYYIHTQFYGNNINKDSLIMALGYTEIDGKKYLGGPKKVSKLYNEDFYYNVNEEYDRIVKNIQKIESRTKIFRKQDFLFYYQQYYTK